MFYILEKGRGIAGSGNNAESKRYEGLAGRFDKLDNAGTGPCPCIPSYFCLIRSY